MGGEIELGIVEKRCGRRFWGPLLRFIGVGILWNWGIIHGKASLSGPVYKMRQGWQRWRPSTTGPSCFNMGLSHLTYPVHHSKHSAFQGNTHQLVIDTVLYTKHDCQLLSEHLFSCVFFKCYMEFKSVTLQVNFSFWLHTFSYHKTQQETSDFSFEMCHSKNLLHTNYSVM